MKMKYGYEGSGLDPLPEIDWSKAVDVEWVCVDCGQNPDDHVPDLCPRFG